MVYKCCVPNCRGNYDITSKVHVFKFPQDELLKRQWISAVKRSHFVPTKNSVVCELHFNDQDIRKATEFDCADGQKISLPLKVPRLIPGAVPSILPNCPSYLSTKKTYRESPQEKRRRVDNENLQTAIQDSVEEFNSHCYKRSFSNFAELKDKLKVLDVLDSWDLLYRAQSVVFVKVILTPAPKIICSIIIQESLEVNMYYDNTKLNSVGNFIFPKYVNSLDEISNIIEQMNTLVCTEIQNGSSSEILVLATKLLKHACTIEPKLLEPLKFMVEQIELWSHQNRSYSPSFLIISSMLHSISPHCYAYLRQLNLVYLPHPCTIRRLCSSLRLDPRIEQHDDNFLKYIKEKFSGGVSNKYIVLMMDEIYVKPLMDYKAGNVVGKAFNSKQLATSAYCFMVSSLLSDFKEVAHILPVKSMSGEYLNCVLKKVIVGLEKIGLHVVCVVSDNSTVNRKCIQLFSSNNELKCVYPHPADEARSLFFVFDSVHLLKCIRNNWLNKKDDNMCMKYPDFEANDNTVQNASFLTIKKLYDLEHEKFVKYGYGLSLKALSPSSFERQNVHLALQIFNDNVIQGLRVLGEKNNLLHCTETASYIQIIINWWAVVNVKTPGKGARLNNTLMLPVSSDSDECVNYLKKFLCWLLRWRSLNLKGSLTSETMNALILTTEGYLKLVNYCLSELDFSYVLLGKFQTDLLEDRFGKYRQLAGGQYNISVRQLFEVEKKLRIQSSMSLKIKSNALGEIEVNEFYEPSSEPCVLMAAEYTFTQSLIIDYQDFENYNDDDMPILVYLAGYCCYSVSKFLKCQHCKEIIVTHDFIDTDEDAYNLIRNKSRGRLLFPEMFVVAVIIHNYVVVTKLCTDWEEEFLKVNNQRGVAHDLTMKVVNSKELLWEPETCKNGHSSEYVCRKLIWTSTNILLNNYCKKKSSMPKNTMTRKKTVFCQR